MSRSVLWRIDTRHEISDPVKCPLGRADSLRQLLAIAGVTVDGCSLAELESVATSSDSTKIKGRKNSVVCHVANKEPRGFIFCVKKLLTLHVSLDLRQHQNITVWVFQTALAVGHIKRKPNFAELIAEL